MSWIIKLFRRKPACTHPTYYETQACDAICMTCKKNLGFIEYSREANPKGEIECTRSQQ